MDATKIAIKIISKNIYLSLATSDGKVTWNAPLYYVYDKDLNFYFVSSKDSLHAKHIKKNTYVAATIFNSQEIPEKVNGVQFDALCGIVSIKELPKVIKLIYSKKPSDLLKERFEDYKNPLSYIRLTNFRIFKITPIHFYILDPSVTMEDKRIEVRMR